MKKILEANPDISKKDLLELFYKLEKIEKEKKEARERVMDEQLINVLNKDKKMLVNT